jgi:hypothetical protein
MSIEFDGITFPSVEARAHYIGMDHAGRQKWRDQRAPIKPPLPTDIIIIKAVPRVEAPPPPPQPWGPDAGSTMSDDAIKARYFAGGRRLRGFCFTRTLSGNMEVQHHVFDNKETALARVTESLRLGFDVQTDTDEAVEFMRHWPTARIHLWFKKTDPVTGEEGISQGRTYMRTDDGYDRMRAAIDAAQGSWNIYYLVNDPADDITMDAVGKASNAQIKRAVALHVDIDTKDGKTIDEIAAELDHYVVQPSRIVFSGGGIQALWVLRDPFDVGGDLEKIEAIKRYNQQLVADLGGDRQAVDASRVLRLPGTINVPSAKKRAAGRVPAAARLIGSCEQTYHLDAFRQAPAEANSQKTDETKSDVTVDWAKVLDQDVSWLGDLPAEFPRKGRIIIEHGGTLPELCEILKEAKLLEKNYESWSEVMFALAAVLKQYGKLSPEQMAAALMAPLPCNRHVIKLTDNSKKHRAVERALSRSHEPKTRTSQNDDQDLAAMNAQHCIISDMGGKCIVANESKDPVSGEAMVTFSSFEAIGNRYANRKKQLGLDANNQPKFVPLASWWLHHTQHRQLDYIAFAPGREFPNVYNLWHGFAVHPEEGDCSLYLGHIRDNVCQGDAILYDYIIKWMAQCVQRPGEPAGTALVLRGKMGTGKGQFVRWLGSLFGRNFLPVTKPEHITGQFNKHMGECILLFGDECFFAGNKQHEQILKVLVTEREWLIEPKGIDAIKSRSCLHIILAANEEWTVPVDQDDRRYCCIEIGDKHKRDRRYFDAMERQMLSGGREALLHMLLHVDLDGFNVEDFPRTAEHDRQRANTRTGVTAIVEEACHEGTLPFSLVNYPNVVVTSGAHAFDNYIVGHHSLRYVGPVRIKDVLRDEWETKTWRQRVGPIERPCGIEFKPLEWVRDKFQQTFGKQEWRADSTNMWVATGDMERWFEGARIEAFAGAARADEQQAEEAAETEGEADPEPALPGLEPGA